jgi:DNA-directed RNA polymerase subunit E'/Rpb7
MTNLFMPIQFKSSVQLKPNELDDRFEEHLLYKLQQEYEGKCSRHGYIKPSSLTIVQRSMGRLLKPHFNGHIRFDVSVVGEVCNPVEGMVIQAVVKNKNVLGILAESTVRIQNRLIPVLDIIIPKRTAGISSEIALDTLNVGDVINVEILGKRFQLNDQRISIIGRGVESVESVQQRRQKNLASKMMVGGGDDLPSIGVPVPEEEYPEESVGGDSSEEEEEYPDADADVEKPPELPLAFGGAEAEEDADEEYDAEEEDIEDQEEVESEEYCD